MQGVVEFRRIPGRGRSQLSKPRFPAQRCPFEVQIEAAAVQTLGAGPSQLGVFNQEPRAARRKVRLADYSPRDQAARVASKCVAPSSRAIWFSHLVLDRLSKRSVSLGKGEFNLQVQQLNLFSLQRSEMFIATSTRPPISLR